MPDPKTCAAKGLAPGTKEYEDCVGYKGAYADKGKSQGLEKSNPVKGKLKSPTGNGGGY